MSFLFWPSRGSILGFISEIILLISSYICLLIWSRCCQHPAHFSSAPSISVYVVSIIWLPASVIFSLRAFFISWSLPMGRLEVLGYSCLPPQEQPSIVDLQKLREKPLGPFPFGWDNSNACPILSPQHGWAPVAPGGSLLVDVPHGCLLFPTPLPGFPGIISHINYLHLNSYFRVCF